MSLGFELERSAGYDSNVYLEYLIILYFTYLVTSLLYLLTYLLTYLLSLITLTYFAYLFAYLISTLGLR